MKRKILIIPSWYPTLDNKALGSFYREQALSLGDNFDLYVITISPRKTNFFSFFYFYLARKFFYYEIPQPPSGFGIIYWQIGTPAFLSYFIPFVRRWEKFNYKIMCRYSYLSLMNKIGELNWNPDFIHAQSVINGGIFAHYLSDKFKVPYLITEHQVFLMQYYNKYEQNMIYFAIRNAKCFMVVSEHQKRQILMNGIACNPLVLGNMVDDNHFTINKAKKDVFNILAVTYPHYIKDNDTLFNAIKSLVSNAVRDFKVLIVGGDVNNPGMIDKENPLYKQAESYGVSEYVEILNQVDREKMPEIYNKCDVLVSTSIAETFGIACCEAMMCGVPVIATANGGIDEMLTKQNGIKVPIGDHSAVAKAILQIKNKEILFNPEEVRSSVIGKFGKDAFRNKLMEIYKSV